MRVLFPHHFASALSISLLCAWTALAQQAGFYRIAAPNDTRIVHFDAGGLLTWTSSRPTMSFGIEWAPSADGPWTSDVPHIVVANTSPEKAALVPTGPSFTSTPIRYDGRMLACVQNTAQIGTNIYRIETYLWRDFMPIILPGTRPGLLANIRVVETNLVAIPCSLTMTRVWIIHGSETWTVAYPTPGYNWQPHILETTLRDGPFWEPGILVDVVLQVSDGSVEYLLKAGNQLIHVVW
jgi:hypothetical protein